MIDDLDASSPQKAQLSLQGCRILLAEDNLVNQVLVVEMLKKPGAEITAVEDGEHALNAALAARDVGKTI